MILNVLYLRSSFDPGGTETLLLNLYNDSQEKIRFHYALLKDGNLISQLQTGQNRYYRLFRQKTLDFKVINKLTHLVKDEDIRVVHSHQLIELVYALLLKICKPGLRVFHTVHGYQDKQWAFVLERFLIRVTYKTFTVSETTKQNLCDKGYKKIKLHILPNAVKETVQNQERIQNIRNELGISPDNIVIGMIGNFVFGKDQLAIIRAYNYLRNDYPKLKLIFIGRITERTEECKMIVLKEDLNVRVFFLGALDKANEVLSLYDLFIMSSTSETFGIAIVEAILAGVPVLASDIGPMKELSEDEKYFPLFQTGNSQELKNKIIDILKDNKLNDLKKFTKETSGLINKKYSYNTYIDKLYDQYIEATK